MSYNVSKGNPPILHEDIKLLHRTLPASTVAMLYRISPTA